MRLKAGSRLRRLRLRPFDTATAEGRAAERYRLAACGALANVFARGASMALMLLSVGLTVPYLGAERFGVWAAFSSMVAMLSFLDLGVGNAIVNRVAHASADASPAELRRVVAGSVGLLAAIGAGAAALLAAVAAALPWNAVFRLSDPALVDEARRAALVFAALFGWNLFSSGVLKVLAGQQRSYEVHLYAGAATVVACAATAAAAAQRAGIPTLLAASFGVQSLAGLVALGLLLARRQLRGSELAAGVRSERAHLLKSGSLFLVLQIGTMVGLGSDSVILASTAGAAQVAVYAIAQRLFLFASLPMNVLNSPLWAAYADAHARGDTAFMRRAFARSLALTAGVGAGLSLALLAASGPLIERWTHDAIDVPFALLAAFCAWAVIEMLGHAFAMYLNGAGIVREQVAVVAVFCALVLPLKLYAATRWGAAGVVCATLTAYVATHVLLYGTLFRRSVLAPLVPALAPRAAAPDALRSAPL